MSRGTFSQPLVREQALDGLAFHVLVMLSQTRVVHMQRHFMCIDLSAWTPRVFTATRGQKPWLASPCILASEPLCTPLVVVSGGRGRGRGRGICRSVQQRQPQQMRLNALACRKT